MNTQRLNPPKVWYMDGWFNCNKYFIGFTHLITDVGRHKREVEHGIC